MRAVTRLVVAAVVDSEHPANVVTRWTAQSERLSGIALVAIDVTGTVEVVVVATVHCGAEAER